MKPPLMRASQRKDKGRKGPKRRKRLKKHNTASGGCPGSPPGPLSFRSLTSFTSLGLLTLLHRHPLRQVPRLIHISPPPHSGEVGQELQRHHVDDRLQQ